MTEHGPRQPADRFGIHLKRVYEPPGEADGQRILVERLWPRGLSKDRAAIDHWLQDIAPSPELRRWFGHRPERWPEFRARYRAELDANGEAVGALETLLEAGPVTFVFAARDIARNGAVALKAYFDARRRRRTWPPASADEPGPKPISECRRR